MNRLPFTLPPDPSRVWQEHGFVQAPTESALNKWLFEQNRRYSHVCRTHIPWHGGPITHAYGNEPEDWVIGADPDAEPSWNRRSSDIDPLKRAWWYGAVWGGCAGILTTIGLLAAVGRLG